MCVVRNLPGDSGTPGLDHTASDPAKRTRHSGSGMFGDHRELLKTFASARPFHPFLTSLPTLHTQARLPPSRLPRRASRGKGLGQPGQGACGSSHLPVVQKPRSKFLRGSLTGFVDRKWSGLSPTPAVTTADGTQDSHREGQEKEWRGAREGQRLRSMQHPPLSLPLVPTAMPPCLQSTPKCNATRACVLSPVPL